jgi:NAD(P)-dependent dehydrogenase (short-subunit alcohol dehydrogenase family)
MADPGAVLITGCSSGIGRATAIHLAKAGHTVYASARRPESIEDLASHGCQLLSLDVTSDQSAAAAVAEVEAAHGAVGTLINNAGYGQNGAIETVPLDALRAQFETNVIGTIRMTQQVLPAMRAARKGRIVNLSSVLGRVTLPGNGVYSASKFAIEALSDSLRFELAGFGIRVIVIEPGPIRTEFSNTSGTTLPPSADGAYAKYHEAIAKAESETDSSKLAAEPEAVAAVITKAITAGRPRARYTVTPIARVLPALRTALPTPVWDVVMGAMAPRPK